MDEDLEHLTEGAIIGASFVTAARYRQDCYNAGIRPGFWWRHPILQFLMGGVLVIAIPSFIAFCIWLSVLIYRAT